VKKKTGLKELWYWSWSKGGLSTVEDERGPGVDFMICFSLCDSHQWGAAILHSFCLYDYLIIKVML